MLNDSGIAEDIVDSLMAMSCVDNLELVTHAFEQLDEKDKDKFVADIAERYNLMTFDEAMEVVSDAKSI